MKLQGTEHHHNQDELEAPKVPLDELQEAKQHDSPNDLEVLKLPRDDGPPYNSRITIALKALAGSRTYTRPGS
ncbi:hypothetical protein N7471_012935 [Penicillium samsonianum]|uniref:uncharacterized protein n=1 Tax=Penicillium samsonianum TaxID=1882272 RepID=UPI00254744C1|nr:uncharacterized protein N7471_012935 [Penicillium samsonianum]KAJ6125618.1 hypothetical protein N7471_012935 [Penicillium samsonianum]